MIQREIAPKVLELFQYYPIVSLTGPRQSGKTTLLKSLFPEKPYVTLENPDTRLLATTDPRRFLATYTEGAILDEVQNVPEIFRWVRARIDGPIFEGMVAAEIAKAQLNRGIRRELYFFRDEQGLEVDFLVPSRAGGLHLVECKASRTVMPAIARPMLKLAEAFKKKNPQKVIRSMTVIHQASLSDNSFQTLAPGVRAIPFSESIANQLR